jgi:hypothetical protein
MRKLVAVIILLSTLAAAQSAKAAKTKAAGPSIPGVPAAMHSIDAERIKAQVKFLSDDLLEGRGTGQRGGDVAARYLAAEFELYGLKPAGDNGTYFQKVPMVGVTTDQKQSKFAIVPSNGSAMNLAFGADYITTNLTQTETADVDAPIVFAGYGIDAPEYQWNDFKDVDVKGKVVMLFVNEPPSDDPKFFTGRALTYYGRWTYKYEQAARRGAVGVLLIHKTEMAPQDRDGQLWLGRGQELVVGREIVPAHPAGRAQAEGGVVDPAGGGAQGAGRRRAGPRQAAGRRQAAGLPAHRAAALAQGAHREPGAALYLE